LTRRNCMHRGDLNTRFLGAAMACALLMTSAAWGGGTVIYVDDDAPAGGDGLTWTTAFRFLKDALELANTPGNHVGEIHLAQGVYTPDRSEAHPQGTGDVQASFPANFHNYLFGGYAGLTGPDPDARDVQAFETILSGDLAGDDLPDAIVGHDN